MTSPTPRQGEGVAEAVEHMAAEFEIAIQHVETLHSVTPRGPARKQLMARIHSCRTALSQYRQTKEDPA